MLVSIDILQRKFTKNIVLWKKKIGIFFVTSPYFLVPKRKRKEAEEKKTV